MAVSVYYSTDASAPTLSGTAGSLISVLDACLVNGYGAKSAAGWTKPYSGTNLAAYRMVTGTGGTGFYLRIDDTGTTTARAIGYETMSGINSGTGAFPSEIQQSGGNYILKSTAASSAARPWMLVAEGRSFYLFAFCGQTTFGNTSNDDCQIFFGDIITEKPTTDGYQCALISQTVSGGTSSTLGALPTLSAGHFLARSYTGLGGSIPFQKIRRAPDCYSPSNATYVVGGAFSNAYPDPVTGNLNLWKIECVEGSASFSSTNPFAYRGFMPGFYEPAGGTLVGNNFDTFNGSGSLSGLTFVLLPLYNYSYSGRLALQTNGSWY